MAEVLVTPASTPGRPASGRTPPLYNGDHLSGREFLRRYEAMPEVKKAELINGVVYMGSPVRFDQHGEPDALIQVWLGSYSLATPGVKHAANSTTRLGPDDVPQPDGLLCLASECGGQVRLDAKGYLEGAPELVVEVAASSVSIDARDKLVSYRRAGVREYIVWRTEDECVDWWVLVEDEYRALAPEPDGSLHSRVFPGLWLNTGALLARDGPNVLSKLQEGLQSADHTAFTAELEQRQRAPTKPGK
jgi:Uma2 family endonuclease